MLFLFFQFLSQANITEYMGTVTSLIEMIYWVTGETLTEDYLVGLLLRNYQFKNCTLSIQNKNGQKIVHILMESPATIQY